MTSTYTESSGERPQPSPLPRTRDILGVRSPWVSQILQVETLMAVCCGLSFQERLHGEQPWIMASLFLLIKRQACSLPTIKVWGSLGLPWWSSVWESAFQCRERGPGQELRSRVPQG